MKKVNYYTGENEKSLEVTFDVRLDEHTYYTILALEKLGYDRSDYFDCLMNQQQAADIYNKLDVIEKEINKLKNADKKKSNKK